MPKMLVQRTQILERGSCTYLQDLLQEVPFSRCLEVPILDFRNGPHVFLRTASKFTGTTAVAEDILVFADQAGLCQRPRRAVWRAEDVARILEKAPDGRVASRKIITKPPRLLTAEPLSEV